LTVSAAATAGNTRPQLRRFLICISFIFVAPCQADITPPARAGELVRLVRQDCGSCHGLRLKGGLGPALLPATLADKPAGSLVATVLGGRPGTAMPPWRGMLTEEEAEWIVARLQSGFPEE
jgi:cytochrome c55X